MHYWIVGSLFALLSACTSPPRWMWQHPEGVGAEVLAKDRDACQKQAAQTVSSTWIGIPYGDEYWDEKETEFRNCMKSRGWVLVPTSEKDAPAQNGR